MFTTEVLFGFDLLSLAGFVLMGAGLTLNRQQKVRFSTAAALMGVGTALLFFGLYVAEPTTP